jgi:Nuclease A inhibitor-like protein
VKDLADMPPPESSEALVEQITTAVTGLMWMSETDAPFEVLHWTDIPHDELTPEQVLHQAQLSLQTPIETMTLDDFLAPVIEPQPWHTEEETHVAQQFQALKVLLAKTLTNIQVYRCGTTELEIYVVGQVQHSDWLVLHTTAVET